MPPLTRRQASLARLDRLRLPEELVEAILTDLLADVIHDAFTFATTWTFDPSVEPMPTYKPNPWSHPSIVRAWQAYDGKVLSRLEDERNFKLILRLAHTNRQFRRIVEYVLVKLCPIEYRDEDEDYEFESKIQDALINALKTLRSLFDQFTEVIYNSSQEKHKSAKEELERLVSNNALLFGTPFAKVHYMNTKIRSYIYTLNGPSYFDSFWEPGCVREIGDAVKHQFVPDPWHRKFLSQSMLSLAHAYGELELGAVTQELQKILVNNQIRGLEDQSAFAKFIESDILIEAYTLDIDKAVTRSRKTISESVERLNLFHEELLPIVDARDLELRMLRPTNAVVTVLEEKLKVQFWNEGALKIVDIKDSMNIDSINRLADGLTILGSLRDEYYMKVAPAFLERVKI